MAATPSGLSGDVRAALRVMVSEYGSDALSSPPLMSNMMADLLPDAPRVAKVLIAAAEDHVADMLADHVSQGMDIATAVRLVTSGFAAATMFTPEACSWAVSEFATALGLMNGAALHPGATELLRGASDSLIGPESAHGYAPGGLGAGRQQPEQAANYTQSAELDLGPQRLSTMAPGTGDVAAPPSSQTPGGRLLSRKGRFVASGLVLAAAAIISVPIWATQHDTAGHGSPPGRPARHSSAPPVSAAQGPIAYVADYNNGTLTPVNLATGTLGAPIQVGVYPAR